MVTDAGRNHPHGLIDEAGLCDLLSVSAARGRRLVREQTFPSAVRRGAGGDLWDLDAVDRWLDTPVRG